MSRSSGVKGWFLKEFTLGQVELTEPPFPFLLTLTRCIMSSFCPRSELDS